MYTDLITEETHNNVQYQFSNTIDTKLYNMITAMPFGIGTAV